MRQKLIKILKDSIQFFTLLGIKTLKFFTSTHFFESFIKFLPISRNIHFEIWVQLLKLLKLCDINPLDIF